MEVEWNNVEAYNKIHPQRELRWKDRLSRADCPEWERIQGSTSATSSADRQPGTELKPQAKRSSIAYNMEVTRKS